MSEAIKAPVPPPAPNPELAKSSPWSPGDIVAQAISDDERLWIPMGDGFWVRPLLFDTTNGAWVNVMRTATSGVISRHRHPSPVHGFVIDGSWHYLEHDWVAEAGAYVYEPAGDTHTLVIDDPAVSHTLFWISGAMIHVDEEGRQLGYADVFTRIEEARRHFEAVGLGGDYVKQLIR
jgi:2,4'-dihydroxyacetophenone dioxygenase